MLKRRALRDYSTDPDDENGPMVMRLMVVMGIMMMMMMVLRGDDICGVEQLL